MAIIQMVNEEVLDVTQTGDDLNNLLGRGRPSPMVELEVVEEQGGGKIWVNAAQISSFR